MVDCDCKANILQSPPIIPTKSPKPAIKRAFSANLPSPENPAGEFSNVSESTFSTYDSYLRLPERRQLWSTIHFPGWENESLIKPALQALEITFRLISIVLTDSRPYLNRKEWNRQLESLARDQIEIISVLCEEDETRGEVPIVDLRSSFGEVIPHTGSSAEVWKLSGENDGDDTVVSRISEYSLLPRLAMWQKSEDISSGIFCSIESSMRPCFYTLGLGEPNLAGKPNLDYDSVCRPSELHALKLVELDNVNNNENRVLFTIHQILESWIFTATQLLQKMDDRINKEEYSKATDYCWIVEKIWKLLNEIENIHILMDPNDFLHLKTQLRLKTTLRNGVFCLRSRGLIELTKLSKELSHKVPKILGVEVDPMGGPRMQEAAMGLYCERRRFEKVHLLQAFQGVESGVKGFYFNYKQLLVVMMGSVESKASFEMLDQLFLEPTYYPSLDGAKTYIGNILERGRMVKNGGNLSQQHRKDRLVKR